MQQWPEIPILGQVCINTVTTRFENIAKSRLCSPCVVAAQHFLPPTRRMTDRINLKGRFPWVLPLQISLYLPIMTPDSSLGLRRGRSWFTPQNTHSPLETVPSIPSTHFLLCLQLSSFQYLRILEIFQNLWLSYVIPKAAQTDSS